MDERALYNRFPVGGTGTGCVAMSKTTRRRFAWRNAAIKEMELLRT